LNVLEVAI